jgi:DNA-binding FadR family transcriptional regulator
VGINPLYFHDRIEFRQRRRIFSNAPRAASDSVSPAVNKKWLPSGDQESTVRASDAYEHILAAIRIGDVQRGHWRQSLV